MYGSVLQICTQTVNPSGFGELSVAAAWSISHYFANVGLPTTSSVFRRFKCLLLDCQLQSQDDDARYNIEEKKTATLL